MQQHVYKRRRNAKGKLKVDRHYTGRFKLAGDAKPTSVSLNVTDKQVAERMLAKIVEEEQKRRVGLPVSSEHSFKHELIEDNLLLFSDDLRSNGRGETGQIMRANVSAVAIYIGAYDCGRIKELGR